MIMTYINITKFVLIINLKKNISMTETLRLKNVVIFLQTSKNSTPSNCNCLNLH